jgi:3-hydroxyacyl-[acyl-carrier-protein] dehydratase
MNSTWHVINNLKECGSQEISAEITLAPDSLWFDGHFPGSPILPGIAQLGLVSDALREHAKSQGRAITTVAIRRVRFRQLVRPGETLQIMITPEETDPASYKFKVLVRGQVACNGSMVTAQRGN